MKMSAFWQLLAIWAVGALIFTVIALRVRRVLSHRSWLVNRNRPLAFEAIAALVGLLIGLVCLHISIMLGGLLTEGLEFLRSLKEAGGEPSSWFASIVVYGTPFSAPAAGVGCWVFAEFRRGRSEKPKRSLVGAILGSFLGVAATAIAAPYLFERIPVGASAIMYCVIVALGATIGYHAVSRARSGR